SLTPTRLTAAERATLWKDLSGTDGSKAHRAAWTLTASGDQAVPFLGERIRQVVRRPVDTAKVEKWIEELDDDRFAIREKASVELEKLGTGVTTALRKALEKSTSAERTRRLNALLEKRRAGDASPLLLASRRAVEILEAIGTAQARSVLEQIVASTAAPEVVEEAQLSLRRLMGRKKAME